MSLELRGIGHAYLGRFVLEQVDLAIRPGEVVALLGPSGSGKSTLLAIAAGIVEPMRGAVRRGYARHGVVFQEPRLMPWATAAENIAYPLRLAGHARAERRDRARAAAAAARLAEADLAKYPVELSGGMRQRVAMARALVAAPDFLFLDEPFTALDVALRRALQDVVIEQAAAARFAALFVTHDVQEAVRLAHRIAVLHPAGHGIAGERAVPGEPGARTPREVFEAAQAFLEDDRLFRALEREEERKAGWH